MQELQGHRGVLYKEGRARVWLNVACLRGYKGKAARAREPYASSDRDLAEMADRGSTTRGMVILPEGGVG